MGDFTGFTFGSWVSSDWEQNLEVLRVSGGDRYDEELQPEIRDITAEVPGIDGDYYFGSNYGPKKIDIEIAFDSLTEAQFRELRRVFGTRKVKELIFDERPYKRYMAKLESPIELSYICFDEPIKRVSTTPQPGVRVIRGEETIVDEETQEETVVPTWERESVYPYVVEEGTQRIYKGEGKISFVCYFPFAKSVFKALSSEEESADWAISSGILTEEEYQNYDRFDSETSTINIYNPGDIDTGFRLYLPAAVAETGVTLNYKPSGNDVMASLVIKPITLKTSTDNVTDMGVLIDTTNELIVGVSQITEDSVITTSGNIYNEYVEAGYFFHLEPSTLGDGAVLEVQGGAQGVEIFYNYLYF